MQSPEFLRIQVVPFNSQDCASAPYTKLRKDHLRDTHATHSQLRIMQIQTAAIIWIPKPNMLDSNLCPTVS